MLKSHLEKLTAARAGSRKIRRAILFEQRLIRRAPGAWNRKLGVPGFSARGDNNEVWGFFLFLFFLSLSFQRREPATVRIKESRPVPSLSSFAISRPSSDTSSVDFHFPDGSLLIPGAGHPSTTGKKRSSFYHTTLRGDKQTRFHDCGIRPFDLRRPSRSVNPRLIFWISSFATDWKVSYGVIVEMFFIFTQYWNDSLDID